MTSSFASVANKKSIIFLVVILNLPFFLINAFHLVSYRTTIAVTGGDFAQLDYFMNIFELLILIIGIFKNNLSKSIINIYPILFFVFIKDILLTLHGYNSPFTWNSWELYLAPLIAMGAIRITGKNNDYHAFELLLELLIIFNFIYQVLFLLTGRVGEDGRVTVMNQGVGSVGMMCAYYIVYTFLLGNIGKKQYILIIISLISIILSGSRFSLLIVLISLLANSGYVFRSLRPRQRNALIVVMGLLTILTIFILSNSEYQDKYEILSRMSGLFENNSIAKNINEDASFLERLVSFTAGFEIMKEHPFGISNSFVDLQTQSIAHGFFSFPHSTLMTYYLLWGPMLFYCVYWMIKKIRVAIKLNEKGASRYLIIMLICFTVYGGIETSPKVYIFLFASICAITLRLENKQNYEIQKKISKLYKRC